jgi:hypothetical protein
VFGEQTLHRGKVAKRMLHKRYLRVISNTANVGSLSRGIVVSVEIIEADDALAGLFEQSLNEVAPDKARTARNKNRHGSTSTFLVGRSWA